MDNSKIASELLKIARELTAATGQKQFDPEQAWKILRNTDEFGIFIETLDVTARQSAGKIDIYKIIRKYMRKGDRTGKMYIIDAVEQLSDVDKKKMLNELSKFSYRWGTSLGQATFNTIKFV
jgi:hypothetical protein